MKSPEEFEEKGEEMSGPISIPHVIDQLASPMLSDLKRISTQEPQQADKSEVKRADEGRIVWCDGHSFSVADLKSGGIAEKKIVKGSSTADSKFRDEIHRLFGGDVPKSVEVRLGKIKRRAENPLEVRRLRAVLSVADGDFESRSGLSELRAPMEKGDRSEYLKGLEKVLDSRLGGLGKPLAPDATMLKAYADTIRQSICGTPEDLMNLRSILAAEDKALAWKDAQGKGSLGLTLKALCSGTLAMIDNHVDEWTGVSAKAGAAPRETGGKLAEFEDSLNELADAVARFDGPAARKMLLRQQELLSAGKNDPVVGLYGELANQIAGGDGTGGIFGGDRKYLKDTRAILENLHELAVRKDDSLAPELRVARRQTAHVCETLLRELVSFDEIREIHVAAAKVEKVEGEDAQDVRSVLSGVSERPQALVDKVVKFGSPSERRRINRFGPVGELVNPRNVRALLGRVRAGLPKDARKGRALVIARSLMEMFAEIRFRQTAKGGKVDSFDGLMDRFAKEEMIGSCDFSLSEQELKGLKGPLHDRFVKLLSKPAMGEGYCFSPETGVLSIAQREVREAQLQINGQIAQPVVGEVRDGEEVVSEEALGNLGHGASGTDAAGGLAYHALMIRSFPRNNHLRSVVSSLTSMTLDMLSGVTGLFTGSESDFADAVRVRSGATPNFLVQSERLGNPRELTCGTLGRDPIDKGMYDIRTDSEGRVRIEAYRGVGMSLTGNFVDDLSFAHEDDIKRDGIVYSAQTYRAVMTIDPKKMIEGNDVCKDYPDVTIERLEALDTPGSWPDIRALKASFPD